MEMKRIHILGLSFFRYLGCENQENERDNKILWMNAFYFIFSIIFLRNQT